jgi:hypothetical protein
MTFCSNETIWRLDFFQQPDAPTKFCKNLEFEVEMKANIECGDLTNFIPSLKLR